MRGTVLEPITLGVVADMKGSHGNVELAISNIRLSVSPDILELFMKLQSSILSPMLQPAAAKPLAKCSVFTKVRQFHSWNLTVSGSGSKAGYSS